MLKKVRMPKGTVTKRNIEDAAGRLFSEQGFDAVTMREIAKAAGCSHTLIYMYYRDKEDLFRQMAGPRLEGLELCMSEVLDDPHLSPAQCLETVSRDLVEFCLTHRCMVSLLFGTSSHPPSPDGEGPDVEKLRVRLFRLLHEAVARCLPNKRGEAFRSLYRLYLFMLHGMVMNGLDRTDPSGDMPNLAPLIESGVGMLLGAGRPLMPLTPQ